jgi:ketosteroid isomerase-like protein
LARADDAAVKKELNALFGNFAAAFRKKDVKTAMSFFAPDYTATEGGRTLTRAQVEAQTAMAMSRLKSVDALSWNIQKLTVKGSTATTVALESMTATIVDTEGQMGPKGQTHKIKDVERTRDRFVKTSKGWLLKHSETLSADITIDGKKLAAPTGR